MISSDVIRGYNDLMILFILLERDSYGYEVSKEIEKRSKQQYSIKETTLYSAFTRLEKKGYIASYYGNETHGKRRTYYKVTNAGIEYYKEKCEEWQITQDVINQFIRRQEDGNN